MRDGERDIVEMSPDEASAALQPFVDHCVDAYDLGGAEVTLLNLSENATYLIRDGDDRRILRVHRRNYHDRQAIESELTWLAALQRSGTVRTPAVIPAADGAQVVRRDDFGRLAVCFEFLEGAEPDSGQGALTSFARLGGVTAKLHEHARTWSPPTGFRRFSWDLAAVLGPQARFGDWRSGPHVEGEVATVLGAAANLVGARLQRLGVGREHFGLIHADLRLANLLAHGDEIGVIDFDDTGFGWYLADFGGAVTFIETDPRLPELSAAWCEGYRRVAPLSDQQEHELLTFVMLRRLMMLGWLASHASTPTAEELAPTYAAESSQLAETYLSSHG